MSWDGEYFVTLRLANGRTVRRNTRLIVPDGAVVEATDNGYYASDADLSFMGRQWAYHCLQYGAEPCSVGNQAHDAACADEAYKVLGHRVSWDRSPLRRGERR